MKTTETVIYDSAKQGSPALEELRGIFIYRDLIFQLVRRDVLTRYKRSVLGIAWTMLQPLGMMIIMTLVFSTLFSSVKRYPTYILSGMIAWTFFSQSTMAIISQTVWGGQLFRRIYLPRTAFAVSSIGTGLVNIVLSLVPLFLIMVVTGTKLHWTILVIPLVLVLLAAFALGIGLIISTLAVFFPDVIEMYQIVLLAWMYLTPIIYPEKIIPETYRYWFFNLNPMYHLVKLFRTPLYDGLLPDWKTWLVGIIVSVITLMIGWYIYARKADEFAYYS
jgi:homopolymeric O-antigen transport system permease protein